MIRIWKTEVKTEEEMEGSGLPVPPRRVSRVPRKEETTEKAHLAA
jgi:hypothetical protein